MATQSSFPPTFPADALEITQSRSPREQAMKRALALQSGLIRKMGRPVLGDLGIHPVYPFSKLFTWHDSFFMPRQLSHFYWYLASTYTIAVEFQTIALQTSVRNYQEKDDLRPAHQILMEMLQWFRPLSWWEENLELELRKIKDEGPSDIVGSRSTNPVNPLNCYTIIFLRIKCRSNQGPETKITYDTSVQVHKSSKFPMPTINNLEFRELQKLLFIKNKVIPDEIWPSPEMDAPWERYPPDYAKQIDEDLTHYLPSAETTPDSSPSSSSRNPRLSPLLQDSQDPYDLSPWSLSRVDEELLEADRQWERDHPEPPPSRADFAYYRDIDSLSDYEYECMNLSPSHERD